MSTANKLTYLNETKQELKQKINNLGGDIDDETTFREYANQLDGIYEVLPKTEFEEGSDITLENTLKGKLDFEDGIVGYGQTSQEGTPTPDNPQEIEVVRGKNILDMNLLTTISSNRYISSGTNHISIQPNTTYTFSVKSSTGVDGLITIYDKSGNPTATYAQSQASRTSVTFTTGANDSYLIINRWYIDSTAIVLADTEPMLEKGSQATSYLPYNTLEVVERGINLLELKISTITLNGITCINNEDGSLTFSGTATDNVNFRIDQISQSGPYVLKNYKAPYTMSLLNVEGTNKGTMYLGGYIDGSWSTPNCNIGTVAVKNENLDNAFCYIRFNKDDVINETIYPMILNGSYTASTIPPFQPYQTPQTYQLSLGEYEFAKIGNYVDTIEYDVDEDKVYKGKAVGKAIINGNSGTISRTTTNRFNIDNAFTDYFKGVNLITYLSNQYIAYQQRSANAEFDNLVSGVDYGFDLTSGTSHTIRIKDKRYDNIEDFETALNNNNLILYYALNEIVKEEITTTLKDQIKALYYSHSFTGTTIIEIDGQLPLIIKVRALKGE